MLERVHDTLSAEREEKQALQQELQQKSEESSDLQKENQLLKEENKDLQEKLASSQALVNQLQLLIQTLEEEKRQDREANEVRVHLRGLGDDQGNNFFFYIICIVIAVH